MSYTFTQLTPEEFTVKDHRIYKDGNGSWIATPPIENTELQKAVNNYINEKETEVRASERKTKSYRGRGFRKLRSRTGTL